MDRSRVRERCQLDRIYPRGRGQNPKFSSVCRGHSAARPGFNHGAAAANPPPTGDAQPLSNGSFEAGYTSWSPSGNQRILSGRGAERIDAVQFNASQNEPNAVLSQTFATAAGQAYTMEFEYGAGSAMVAAEQAVQVTVQGQTLLASQRMSAISTPNGPIYATRSIQFKADSAQSTVTFRDVSPTSIDVDSFLDHVRLRTSSVVVPPAITTQPLSRVITQGQGVSFSVGATGSAPLTYQWTFNGNPLAGATAATYAIPSAQTSHTGNYAVVIKNGAGAVTSATAVLNVQPSSTIPAFSNGSFENDYAGWTVAGNQRVISPGFIR